MDIIELIPGLHFLRFPVGHAYLCEDPDGLALIDTSLPGSAPQIAAAIRSIGHDPADLRWLMLTHFHPDHAGSAAEIAAWGSAGCARTTPTRRSCAARHPGRPRTWPTGNGHSSTR